MRTWLFGAATLVGATLAIAQDAAPDADDRMFGPIAPLTIHTADGDAHVFHVELADEDNERSQGLMFRESLAPDAGMVFDYGEDRVAAMWMKNTLIPLDMVFFDASGEIVSIARNARPHSERIITSGAPVRGVLEIPAGRATELGLKRGDRLEHFFLDATEPAERTR
ncbi:MAG: DUF192 domain-containing protein [Maricaulaceae bacterium]